MLDSIVLVSAIDRVGGGKEVKKGGEIPIPATDSR